MHAGFTLIELLLVIGVIGVVAGIVIMAVNPFEQLGKTQDTERRSVMRETEKAQYQYLIDEGEYAAASAAIPEGEANAKPICRYGKTNIGCITIDALVPVYVSCIAFDGREANPDYTGYRIYQQAGRVRVLADYLEQGPADSGCENAETVAMAGATSSAVSAASAASSAGGSVLGIRRRPARVAVTEGLR